MTNNAFRSKVVIAFISLIAIGYEHASAQYLGYFIDGTWREVQFDRSIQEREAKYIDGQLWRTPVSMSGAGVRTGILLDASLGPMRHLSIVWCPAVMYTQFSGRFNFSSGTPPFATDLLYPLNGSWYSDNGTRQIDVFSVESLLALKVRVAHGLVIRLGVSAYLPLYAIQRTQWSRSIKDDSGQEYVNQLDETVSGGPDKFSSENGSFFAPEGFVDMGYEFKNGFGLFIRGSRSPEMSRDLHYNTRPSSKSNWRTYSMGLGICFRLVRNPPASNWGGVKPMSPTEIRQRRHEERLGSTVQPSDSGSDPFKSYDASAKEDRQQVGTVAEPDKEPTVADTLSVPTPRTTSDSVAKPAGNEDRSAPGAMPIGLRQINTPPLPGEIRRYTVLHPFSALDAPDTFRVVTVDGSPAWHYLEIVAASGQRLYKAEIFTLDPLSTEPVPLERGAWEATVLRDMLGPWAFGKPMPRALYEAFLDRERRGLHYSVTNDQVEAILMDPAAVSFSFSPEPGDTRLLAVDRRTGTVVNLAPSPQE